MEDKSRRQEALAEIERHIVQHGHHVYVVSDGPEPRFAYTIGLSKRFGSELILAGSIIYMYDEVVQVINRIAAEMSREVALNLARFEVPSCGSFSLRNVDPSWAKAMMLGAIDFYQTPDIPALQIIPDQTHWTVDIPDMSVPWNSRSEPIWQWLQEPWQYQVSPKSKSVTNLAALRGGRITEAMRWEDDEWELFAGAGPDVPADEVRVVPLGTLIAVDPSLVPVMNLAVGSGFWRDEVSAWHPWGKSA